MLALPPIAWNAFHAALERALATIEDWLATTEPTTRDEGSCALVALRTAWYAERFDHTAYTVLCSLVTRTPSSIAARSAVEAIGAWRAELEEAEREG
jgi:hypothetical protein